jgi:hypothetical protein
MTTKRTNRLIVTLLAVVLLGTAGCSSDEGSDGKAPGTTAATGGGATTSAPKPAGKPLARYADYATKSYDDPTHWVCRPDEEDICDGDLDSTTIEADGTLTPEPFEAAKDPAIDCFYVYPTISRDETNFADWDASEEEEGYVTLNQAARLASTCRVFAPVYRQVTLTSLTNRLSGAEGADDEGDPFADVLDAFRTYMATDNGGRGFVLIGHSQGAGMLNELIKTEIDPNEDVRAKLVSAYLAGGTVAVPEGKAVGGDFENVPVCTTADETGCVVTWSTFRSTAPPPDNSFFGKPRGGEGVAGCANPAAIGGEEADLHGYFPANAEASILASLGAQTKGKTWVDESAGEITTPYVSLPGLVSGECASSDGFNYLSVTVHADPGPRADDVTGDLTPEWGLHLIDVNLVMGDIVTDVEAQAKAYAG